MLPPQINKNKSDNVFGKHEKSASSHEFVVNSTVSKVYSSNNIHVSLDNSNSNSYDTNSRSVISPGHNNKNTKSTQSQNGGEKVMARMPKVKTTDELIKKMSASDGL